VKGLPVPVEVLSFDHSSDECLPRIRKHGKEMMGQASTVKSKSENSGARAGAQLFQSESWNPESPHPPDYTDDEEKTSIGVDHTTAVEALQKLRWPENHGNLYEEDAPGIGIPNSPIEQKVEKPGILESTKQSEDSSTEECNGTEEED
jgi:hypothetical protein